MSADARHSNLVQWGAYLGRRVLERRAYGDLDYLHKLKKTKKEISFFLPKTRGSVSKMKAVVIKEFYESCDQVTVSELPTPESGSQDILIKVIATGVNFVDTLYVRFFFRRFN